LHVSRLCGKCLNAASDGLGLVWRKKYKRLAFMRLETFGQFRFNVGIASVSRRCRASVFGPNTLILGRTLSKVNHR
ncbi:MAG: hypothetical protein ABJ307_14705, partial [Lentilitoribacter sp.]